MGELYSRHIFIFPFVWDRTDLDHPDHASDFNQRKDLTSIRKFLSDDKLLKEYRFRYETIVYDEIEPGGGRSQFNTYNEKKYFYEFAYDVLNLNSDSVIDTAQFYADLSPDASYSITVKNRAEPFKLWLSDAIVNFYNSGVGIVAFFLENKQQYTFDEILTINEYGRRIYPQFIGDVSGLFTEDTKESFLADRIEVIYNLEAVPPAIESFGHYETFDKIAEADFVLPAHVMTLLGKQLNKKICVRPIMDDRMYTMCFIRDAEILQELKVWQETEKEYAYTQSAKWHRLIYVDDSQPSCKSKTLLPVLNNIATYDRWIDNVDDKGQPTGHLFGITRYSFVLLASPCRFTDNVLKHHFAHQYFQMALLAIIQRGSVLSFSAEIKRISRKLKDKDIKATDVRGIEDLHRNYTIFLNRIFFREVTAQEQGIDLYEMLQKNMKIKDEAEYLKAEIESLNEFVRNREAYRLTWIASLYLPATLLASVICWFATDIKTYSFREFDFGKAVAMALLILMVVLSLAFHKPINRFILRKTNR